MQKIPCIALAIILTLAFGGRVFSQTVAPKTAVQTSTSAVKTSASASSTAPVASGDGTCSTRAECQSQLAIYEKLLVQYESDIKKTAGEKKTLQNQIALLRKKADSLTVQIKKGNAIISDVKQQINDTETSIEITKSDIEKSQEQLAAILRSIHEANQRSPIEIILAEAKLSDFFDNVVYLENLNDKSNQILRDIKSLKTSLEDQKSGLSDEQKDLENQVQIQSLQKQEHEKNKKEQEQTLKLTEAEYQKSLTQKKATEAKVAAIKARIFELAGLGNTKAPNFEEAYAIAKHVGSLTGVRPAFLLAILTQESNIGKNVGQCYLKDPKTGDGAKISTGLRVAKVMHPTRDVPPFLTVTSETGRDPYATQVSCPMSFGWGGAMGPAQFIPSTWMVYRDRIAAIIGRPADPWNINDAFMATGLYVSDYGATSQTTAGEWKAAMIYFSGSTNTKYRFYGDSAVSIAQGYADDIAAIEGK